MNLTTITNAPPSTQAYTDAAHKLLQIPQLNSSSQVSSPCLCAPQSADIAAGGLIGGFIQLFDKMLNLLSGFLGGGAANTTLNSGEGSLGLLSNQMQPTTAKKSDSGFVDTLLSFGKEILGGLFGGNEKSSGSSEKSSSSGIISSIGSFISKLF